MSPGADKLVEILFGFLLAYHSKRVDVAHRYVHEAEDERQARIHLIAEKEIEACRKNPLPEALGYDEVSCVALKSTISKWESGLLQEVHSGLLRGPAKERCLDQIHHKAMAVPSARFRITEEEWENLEGLSPEHTATCLGAGMKILAWHVRRCSIRREPGGWSYMAGIFAEYHLPSVYCRAVLTPMAGARGRDAAALELRLRIALKKA